MAVENASKGEVLPSMKMSQAQRPSHMLTGACQDKNTHASRDSPQRNTLT